jgi:hypothetical protein
MANENLLAYLHKRKDKCSAQLADYDMAIAERAMAEENFRRACNKVESFGDVDMLKEERDMLSGFISDLNGTDDVVENSTDLAETVAENGVALDTAII